MYQRITYILLLILAQWPAIYSQVTKPDNLKAEPPLFKISGQVVDSISRAPIEYVTVGLLSSTGNVINTTFTDSRGRFIFSISKEGSYQVRFSFVGYSNLSKDISVSATVIDLGQLILRSESKQLAAIQVTGRKSLIQSKGDRLIYNAGSDIGNKSGNAADVLRKAPLVTVDPAGNVKMRGNSSIKVLLNGRPSGMMARNLKDALKMIPASTIESVEIITNPSAKYDAEGAAGVINIITKKKLKGTSGNLDLSAGNLERTLGGGLNISTGKFSMDLSLGASREKQRNIWDMDRKTIEAGNTTGQLLQKTDATELGKGMYGDFSGEYRPDSSQMFGIGFSYWDGTFPSKSSFYNRLIEKNQPAREYQQNSDQRMKFGSYDVSINYHKTFKRTGQELELLGQYSRSFDNASYTTLQYALPVANKLTELAHNRSNNNDFSFQADYAHPLNKSGKHLLEIGTKYSDGKASSRYNAFNSGTGSDSSRFIEDPSRSNVMDYSQRTFAGYISLQFKIKHNWTFRPGLRYENTQMGGNFQQGAPRFNASFNNLVPTLLILRTVNDQHTLKFNFSQRIRRPAIWDLNPYVNASDPQNITSGNPNLRPEITRMFELGHDFNAPSGFTLNSSIYYSKNDNAIESLTSIDSGGISRTIAQNIASINRMGSNINASLQPTRNLTINFGVELYKARFKSDALKVNNTGVFYTASLNVAYQLPADITVDLYGDYSKGDITLQGYNSPYYTYKFSVRKELLNKKAGLTLGISNPFQKHLLQRNYINAPAFRSSQTNRYYNRSVELTFSWKFGGLKSEDREKEIRNDRQMPHGKKKW